VNAKRGSTGMAENVARADMLLAPATESIGGAREQVLQLVIVSRPSTGVVDTDQRAMRGVAGECNDTVLRGKYRNPAGRRRSPR
jgi:hypothetical protein